MGKIVLLVPREEMLHQAHNILQERTKGKPHSTVEMRVIRTGDAVTEARNAIASGASILIARGLQASLMKQYTNVPVVEIVITAQEMALLVTKAKQIVGKDCPTIAVVGFQNMFCDMTYFEQIYHIKLKTYYAQKSTELEEKAREAAADGVDLVIGGDVAVNEAKRAGIPSLFLSITEDSLRMAFAMAENLDFAMGAEKKSNARLETLLDYSFNGVINLDSDGIVTAVNPIMEELLGKKKEELNGNPIETVIPDLEEEAVKQVLRGQQESSALFLRLGNSSVFAVLAPVRVGDETEGAILTCHKVSQPKQTAEVKNPPGLTAYGNFGQIEQRSEAMKQCVHLAKLYSQSEQPVLVLGEAGTEKRLLAESIHNNGLRSRGSFLTMSCFGMEERRQVDSLFGEEGVLWMADGGTLLIEDIESLSVSCQYRLYRLLKYREGGTAYNGNISAPDIRLIAASQYTVGQMQRQLIAKGFYPEFYYFLQGLVLEVPPLRERKEDLDYGIGALLKEQCSLYSRYHVLSRGALDCLSSCPWPGNWQQLETFMKRLVLTAQKRSIDETTVKKVLDELFPATSPEALQEEIMTEQLAQSGAYPTENPEYSKAAKAAHQGNIQSIEEAEIRAALQAYSGRRGQTAQSLGMSKATLWRKMKKYGIL